MGDVLKNKIQVYKLQLERDVEEISKGLFIQWHPL